MTKSKKPLKPLFGVELAPHNKLLGYARVSTDDQDLALQIDALIRHGVKREDIFFDKKSGRTTNRPGWKDVLNDARPGDVLVAWSLDRVSRSVRDLINLADTLHKDGIHLRLIQTPFDTSSPMGVFFFHLMAAIAQLEAGMTGQRTAAGMKAARERGAKFGPKPKFGKAEIKQAVRMLKDGATVPEVAKHFKVSRQLIYPKIVAATGKKLWQPKTKSK